MPSKEFVELMQKCIDIHNRKSADYANEKNPFQNFDRQAQIMDWFNSDIDKAFAGIVAQKLARLAELSEPGRAPKNEAVEDTEDDAVTYMGLWMAKRRIERAKQKDAQQALENVTQIARGDYEVCKYCDKPILNETAIHIGTGAYAHLECYHNNSRRAKQLGNYNG